MTALPLTVAQLVVDVIGLPAPKGSKDFKGLRAGKPILVESAAATLEPWCAAIVAATQARMRLAGWTTLDGPIRLTVDFYQPRPASVTEAERPRPCVPPDGDKLLRAVADAIKQAGAIVDDGRIVSWHAEQWYAKALCGARITIEAIP